MISNGWVPLGPSAIFNGQTWKGNTAPVSGRVTSVVVDPKNAANVYLGTASGGVWRSIDRGLNWTPLMDDQVTLAVGALALDPSQGPDTPRLYVATGEGNQGGESLPGVGLMICTPNPTPSWTLKGNDKLNRARVYKVVLIPTTPIEIWLGTDRGLFHSTDDGNTWDGPIILKDKNDHPLKMTDDHGTPLTHPYQVTDMMYIPSGTPNLYNLYIAVKATGVWLKKQGAADFEWVKADGQGKLYGLGGIDRIALAYCRDQPLNMYVAYGKPTTPTQWGGFLGIWVTSDGGQQWTPRKLPAEKSNQGYNMALAVNPQDPNTVFFGEKELWKSTDAAKSWTRVSESNGDSPGMHADFHAIAFADLEATTVWAGSDGGIWVSSDSGNTFFSRNRGIQTIQYYSIAQHPHEASMILGGAQDNGVSRYEGSGTWDKVFGGDGFFCAVDPKEPKRCYGSYTYMSDGDVTAIQRSDEYGAAGTFKYRVEGIKDTFAKGASKPFYTPFALDPNDNTVLYLGTNRLYRTADFGNGWVAVTDKKTANPFTPVTLEFQTKGDDYFQTITAIAVDPSDSKNVFVGTRDGRVFRLRQDDNDKNLFTPSPATTPPQGTDFISDLLVPPAGGAGNPVLVALGSTQLAWDDIKDLAPGARIYVNSGASGDPADPRTNWTRLDDANLDLTIRGTVIKHSANPVNAIAIDTKDPAHPIIYIGCNLGIFKRNGYAPGATWALYNDNLPNVAIGDLQFHAEKRLLRAATIGRSVWERAVDMPTGLLVDIYIRDNMADVGRPPKPGDPAPTIDPTSGNPISLTSGADIKIDTPFLGIGGFTNPASTTDYTKTGSADYLAFAQLGSDSLRRAVTSRIYVQISNRGPADTTKVVKVRAFWAGKTGASYPKLPDNFWTAFPDSDPDTTVWKPLGPVQSFTPLRAAQPMVVSWDYKMPKDAPDIVGILALATCEEDSLITGPFDPQQLAAQDKHVALREVNVRVQPTAIIVPVVVGVLALAAVGATAGVIYKQHHK